MKRPIPIQTYLKPSSGDFDGGLAYLYLSEDLEATPGVSARQESVIARNSKGIGQGIIVLDFDAEGRLLGLEVISAELVLPQSLYKRLEALHKKPGLD